MQFPRMVTVQQSFDVRSLTDIRGAVREQMNRLQLTDRVRPGDTLAITAGSRGIANIATIIAEIVACASDAGMKPFIVPAMGSHGGGTVEGQLGVLGKSGNHGRDDGGSDQSHDGNGSRCRNIPRNPGSF